MRAFSIKGQSLEKELLIIKDWASKVPLNGIIVEVGCLFGRITVAFAESCDKSTNIYCIDTFGTMLNRYPHLGNVGELMDIEVEFKKNTIDFNNITMIKVKNNDYKVIEVDNIDIFFLDATHKNPNDLLYLMNYYKKIKKGGLLAGHDFHDEFPDVKANVKLFEKILKQDVTLYPGTSLWSFTI